jgi:tRNA dimethylallyltransferase
MHYDNDTRVDIMVGPTASGKSALALEVAKRSQVVILNADAMQMYSDLCIISARPDETELARADHRLYGVWDGWFHGSAAAWVEAVTQEIRACWREGKRPMLVGGTGMYLSALMQGFSPVPEIAESVREGVRLLEEIEGTVGVRAALLREDAVMADRLKAGDTQRMMRALEVIRSSGKSLAQWHDTPPIKPLPEAQFHVHALLPERASLYATINARFLKMMDAGALEEARAVQHLPRHLPMMQSHGLPELLAHLDGTMGLDEAISRAQQHTRNYAKRQITWIRNQCVGAQDAAELLG